MARVSNILAVTVLLGALLAGQQAYPPPSGSPSDMGEAADQQHGVARVSFLGGDVNLQRSGSAELVTAVVNAPLLTGDRLQTAPGASAEVQFDGDTMLRLAQNTDVGFADLTYGRARLQFGAGTVIYRVLRESQMQADIETPSIAIHPLGTADLRISVLENGSTQVTVRAGAADIYGPSGTQRLEVPRSVLVRVNAAGPEFHDSYPPPHDPLDDWSAGRDNALLSSQSYQYAGGDMAGIGDLDANGAWVNSQYGPVWTPRDAAPGWSPYSDGQWVNEPYYGWTWVDAEPWGWAPFHYGRWFWNGGHGWCWWPGARKFRHSWGPAYVGFFGMGGGLGWVALAPFEGFHTWWGRDGFRGNGGFYTERGGVLGSYRNAAFRGGAVGASFAAFSGYRGRFGGVSRDAMAGATPIRGQLPVSTAGYRFHFVDRQAFSNSRLGYAGNRTFFPTPRYDAGAGYSSGAYSSVRPGVSAGGYRPFSQARPSAGASQSNGGWQHFGDPQGSGTSRQGFTASRGESGWHQFGQPDRTPPSGQQNYRGYGSVQPSYRQAPSYRAPTPSYRQPTPSYRQPTPSYRAAPANQPEGRSFSGGSGQFRGGSNPRSEPSRGAERSHGGGGNGGGGGGHHR